MWNKLNYQTKFIIFLIATIIFTGGMIACAVLSFHMIFVQIVLTNNAPFIITTVFFFVSLILLITTLVLWGKVGRETDNADK